MPPTAQVAARVTKEDEDRLKCLFRTKSAGAEFLLPWALEALERAMVQVRKELTQAELRTVLEAHKRATILPDQCRRSYLELRLREHCTDERFSARDGHASWPALQRKLSRFDDTMAAALMVWCAAFWNSPAWKDTPLEAYLRD